MQSRRVRVRAVDWLVPTKHTVNDFQSRLHQVGWLTFFIDGSADRLADRLLDFARTLGTPMVGRKREVIETLAPRGRTEAHGNSLSAMHGMAAFPLHTDGAHRVNPPRYVVLACRDAGKSSTPTVLARFNDLPLSGEDRTALGNAPFLVRNSRRSFYTTVCDESDKLVRYDRGCMVPVGEAGETAAVALDQALQQVPRHEFHWKEGDVLVIDNWQVLHGRGQDDGRVSPDRILFRVSIE